MIDTDARLWHPWLRINRALRVMLQARWSAEAWGAWEEQGPMMVRRVLLVAAYVLLVWDALAARDAEGVG